MITEGQLLGEVIIDDFAVTGQQDTVFEIEIQQICCISDGLKLAGVLQIVSQKNEILGLPNTKFLVPQYVFQ